MMRVAKTGATIRAGTAVTARTITAETTTAVTVGTTERRREGTERMELLDERHAFTRVDAG